MKILFKGVFNGFNKLSSITSTSVKSLWIDVISMFGGMVPTMEEDNHHRMGGGSPQARERPLNICE